MPGVTATLNTNYEGKANAAIEEFKKGKQFVYMHLEGPDECGHQGELDDKLESMKRIDERIFAPVYDYLRSCGDDFRILIVPDHRTPLALRTHTSEPVPFVLYDSRSEEPFDTAKQFNEKAGENGMYFDNGFEMADFFFTDK